MKRTLLLLMTVMTFAGMTMAQDVYFSGKYINSDGCTSAGVYKNGQKIHSSEGNSSFYHTSEDVVAEDGNVYWVDNCYTSDGDYHYADIFKNDTRYLDSPIGEHRHIWAITKSDHLWSVGTMDDHQHAKCWRDNDATPYWDLHAATGFEGNSLAIDVDVDAYDDVFIGGYQFFGIESVIAPRGIVWENGNEILMLPDYTAILSIAVYNRSVYSVCWYKPEVDVSHYYIVVFKDTEVLYGLSSTDEIINGSDHRNWNIRIDAGDVYVSGYYATTSTDPQLATVWKNGEILYQESTSDRVYNALDVNSSGVYFAGKSGETEGSVWKDNTQIQHFYQNECSQVYGLYVDNSCQDTEILTLPFFDGFENGETSWPCWSIIDEGNNNYLMTSYWERCGQNDPNSITPYTGDYCARHSYGSTGNQEGWLISPQLFLQPLQDGTALHFRSREAYPSDFTYEGVWVSTTGTNPSDFTEVWSAEDDLEYEPSATWKYVTVYLNDYQGEAIYIAFKYSGDDGHNWYIDDVSVGEIWEPYLGAFDTPYVETFQYPEAYHEPGYYWYVLDSDHSGNVKCWKHNESENCVYHPYGLNDGTYQDGWLFSPSINLEAGKNYVMNYSSMVEYWENDARSTIWYALDEDDVPEPSHYLLWDEPSLQTGGWETFQDNISQFAGHSVRFAFRYEGTYAHNWYLKDFSIMEGITQYSINVTANNNAWGTVAGGGTYDAGAICTITANANSGYEFKKWSKDGIDVSTSPVYTFTVNENATYTAVFGEPSVTYYTINTEVNPDGAGTVDGAGTYPAGETAYLSATANTGYIFSHWSDGSTANPHSITVTGNATYTATFIQQNYTLTVNADPTEGGTVTGGGNTYHYGDVATFTATANEGYTFVGWSDGNTNSMRNVTVTGNATYTAFFNAAGATMYTVTVVADNPSLGSVAGGGTYPEGAVIQISATPEHDALFVSWNDGNTDNPRMVTVTGNLTFTAQFVAMQQFTITVVSDNPTMGTTTGGGTFSEGTTITISANAFEGYYFTGWDDGNADNPRRITVTQNATYRAQFSTNIVLTYTLTVMCNSTEGTVLGNGTYAAGTEVTIAAIPNSGYEFDKWNDENTQNPRQVTVNDNMVFVAFFKGLGVDENEGNLIELYPNPANDFIHLKGIEANSEVCIYNAMGALVRVVSANADEGIGISDLSSGLYLVRCGKVLLRFMKTN